MTLLTLERFRQLMGLHPFHFWQLQSPQVPVQDACQRLTFEHAWHNANAVGRAEVRAAIELAEERIAEELGYWPGPHYDTDLVNFPSHYGANMIRVSQDDVRGRWLNTALRWAYVQKVGVEVNTKLSDVAVELCRSKGDAYPIDSFKVNYTVPTGTKVEQLELWNGEQQVAPVTMTLDGTSLTVNGAAWLLVKQELYEDWEAKDLDPNNESTFIQTLALYRHYCNPTGITQDTAQAVLEWETRPSAWGPWCCNSGQDPAGLTYSLARVGIRDAQLGYVYLGQAAYDATTTVWVPTPFAGCTPPDRVTVRYLSGLESLSSQWETAIARFAAAEIARPICGCDNANAEFARWQWEVMASGTGVKSMAVSESDRNNPFGTRLGHIYAWRVVRDAYIARAQLAS